MVGSSPRLRNRLSCEACRVIGLGALWLALGPTAVAASPFPDLTRDGRPNIQAAHAVVVDGKTGEALYDKAPAAVVPIASISKLMAALVVRDRGLDLDATATIANADHITARGGAPSKLQIGWTFSHRDLLTAALVASDGRAVSALGRALHLDAEAFAAAMTAHARKLGLEHTHFVEPTGLDARNVSTAREVVTLLRTAIADPELRAIMQMSAASIRTVVSRGEGRRLRFANTNRLARRSRWNIIGGKTGYTNAAAYCLVVATRLPDGRGIVMAFLGAHGRLTRFGDFGRAMRWLGSLESKETTDQ